MNTEEILEILFIENELSQTTKETYKRSIKYFEDITNQTLAETLTLAEREHNWKQSNLRKCLLMFRNEMLKRYKPDTAKQYYAKVISILNFYEIPYGKLPKQKIQPKNIFLDLSELPNQKMIKKCIESTGSLLVKSTCLLLSSTGLSPVDLLNLTIADYMRGTSSYHQYDHHQDVLKAISEMENQKVIATFKGNRQKTQIQYITFTSPESIQATNLYLQLRDDPLIPTNKLFKISRRQLSKIYLKINNQLCLGKTDQGIAKFAMKNLRSYHATQLALAGMNDAEIDILQGRKPSTIIRKHYIKVDVDHLKERYVECLPYLVIDDFAKIQSELEIVKNENIELKRKQDDINMILKRIEKLERMDP